MSVDISENDLLGETTEAEQDQNIIADESHPLTLLKQAINNMPAVDPEKVQAVINKINQGALEILGQEQERIEAAKRIATKILTETADLQSNSQ